MHSAIPVLLVASGLLGMVLGQTTKVPELKPETVPTTKLDTSKWVKVTEVPTKPTMHLWSSTKHLPSGLKTELLTNLPASKLPEATYVPTVSYPEGPVHSTLPEKLHTLLAATERSGVKEDCCKPTYDLVKVVDEKLNELHEISDFALNYTIKKLEVNTCKMEMVSVSHVTPDSEMLRGHILINGVKCNECNNKMTGDGAMPGLSVCVINPIDCSIVDKRHFRTANIQNDQEGLYFKTYMENLGDRLTVVGTSCGDSISGLGIGKIMMKVLKASVDDVKKHGKYAFAVQTKMPGKGLIVKEEQSKTALTLKIKIVGKSNLDYCYEKDNM